MNRRTKADTLESGPVCSLTALDMLTGAFDIEFDIDTPDPTVRRAAAELRSHLRDHLAFLEDAHSRSGQAFRLRFERLDRKLAEAGMTLFGELTLRKSPATRHLGDLPIAVFSLRKAGPAPILSLPRKRPNRKEILAELDDPDHFVLWDEVVAEDLRDYRRELVAATDERGIHAFLKERPILLAQPFSSGHGRWVYASKCLGHDHEVDFMIATRDSSGFEWTMIELEPPCINPFTKRGKPSARLNEAIDQVKTWRDWVQSNLDTARRSKGSAGLGLTDITPRFHSIILIGRETDFPQGRREWRRQLRDSDGIEIHSYDWVARETEARLMSLGRIPNASPPNPGVEIVLVSPERVRVAAHRRGRCQ